MSDVESPKLKRRWFRFSLRTLLVCVTLAAMLLGWFTVKTRQAEQQRVAVEEIRKEAGFDSIRYDWEYTTNRAFWDPPGPPWLQKRLGVDFLSSVIYARGLKTNACLANLEGLPRLRELDLWSYDCEVTDAGLKYVEGLPLENLSLRATKITDAGLEHLQGLEQLRTLNLYQTQITGVGFRYLQGLKQLRNLDLSRTQVNDAGLEHLKELKQLESLNLWATLVTDAGLEQLYGLDQLRSFDVNSPGVTEAGLRKLHQALPNCDIHPLTATVAPVPEDHTRAVP